MNHELLAVLEYIEQERGISKEQLVNAVEKALAATCQKHLERRAKNVEAKLNRSNGSVRVVAIYDVVDAIDTVSAKLDIITKCATLNIPIISCMGTANHTDPTSFKIVDVYETDVCPLARVMRRECKKRNIPKGKVKVLFSTEQPHKVFAEDGEKLAPCSTVFCPATAGLLIADNVIKTLIR